MNETDVHLRLVESIYDAALDPVQWTQFVRQLEDALGGAAVALHMPFAQAGEALTGVFPSYDPDFLDTYGTYYGQLDPFAPFVGLLRIGEPQWGDPVVSASAIKGSEFYVDWLKPQGLGAGGSFCGLVEADARYGNAFISAFRREGRTMTNEHLRLVSFLMPHLRRAVRLRFKSAGLSNEHGALGSALDQLPTGVFLLDRMGRVRLTNGAADRLVLEGDGISLDAGGALSAATVSLTGTLRKLALSSASVTEGQDTGATLRLPRPSGRPDLELLIAPVRPRADRFDRRPPEVAVFVTELDAPLPGSDELLRALYDMTPAEAALARRVGSGESIADAADSLGVTLETARTRLKRLFAKTGTSRQPDLVRLLIRGPASLSAPEPNRFG